MDLEFTPDPDTVSLRTTSSFVVVQVIPMPPAPSGFGEMATDIACETQAEAVEAGIEAFGIDGLWMIYEQHAVQCSPGLMRAMVEHRESAARLLPAPAP